MAGTLGIHSCNGGARQQHLFIHDDFYKQYYCHCQFCGKPIALEITVTFTPSSKIKIEGVNND